MWRVQLVGRESDLSAVFQAIEWSEGAIVQEGRDFYLESAEFESLEDPNVVRQCAAEKLRVIEGAARTCLQITQPLDVETVSRLNEDGQREHFGAAGLSVTFRVVAQDDPGTDPSSAFRKALAAASSSKTVRQVLDRLSGDPSFGNLYAAYEFIKWDMGGEDQIVEKGWASKQEMKRFTMTANNPEAGGRSARHANQHNRHIKTSPMPLHDAGQFVRNLAEKWILTTISP